MWATVWRQKCSKSSCFFCCVVVFASMTSKAVVRSKRICPDGLPRCSFGCGMSPPSLTGAWQHHCSAWACWGRQEAGLDKKQPAVPILTQHRQLYSTYRLQHATPTSAPYCDLEPTLGSPFCVFPECQQGSL